MKKKEKKYVKKTERRKTRQILKTIARPDLGFTDEEIDEKIEKNRVARAGR